MPEKLKDIVNIHVYSIGTDNSSLNIKFRNDTVYLGNKDHDVSYFLNNWGIIK